MGARLARGRRPPRTRRSIAPRGAAADCALLARLAALLVPASHFVHGLQLSTNLSAASVFVLFMLSPAFSVWTEPSAEPFFCWWASCGRCTAYLAKEPLRRGAFCQRVSPRLISADALRRALGHFQYRF